MKKPATIRLDNMTKIKSLYDVLVAAEAVMNKPSSESNLEYHLRRLGVVFPESLRIFYLNSDGVKDPFGKCHWNWWPLSDLVTVSEFLIKEGIHDELPGYLDKRALDKSIVFCDALYCLPAYAIFLDEQSVLNGSVYALNPYSYSAPSFECFAELFARQYPSSSIGIDEPK